ncbi:MAG TPA: MBL fold metallo-hydrolase, partial [Candidatus Bathyarchaeia archaeon]|nr:MBL fold metallo-hydrolase [Candidatus Bathyarchaeia archaeon]
MNSQLRMMMSASAALAIALAAWPLIAGRNAASRTDEKSGVQLLHVQGRVYMLVGAGANITVQVGDQAIVLVDAGREQMSDRVLSTIRTISNKPIEFIFDTSADEDHVGGNAKLAKAGSFTSGLAGEETGASVVAHLKVLDRMSAEENETKVPSELWPSDTYDNDKWELFNDEAVIVEHPHAAHTDGDSVVFFRRSDVLSTGDIFTPGRYPVIDAAKGGTIDGEIDALNQI